MANTPSTSPAEAPEIKSIKELQDKKADTLKYLQDIPGLNDTEKSGFAAEYEAALKTLDTKTDAEKQKDIGSIKEELVKLRESLTNEKQDENEEVDEKEDDETQENGKQKLNVEKEIRGRLDEFKKNIENKLNPSTTPETPTEPLPPATQSAIQDAQKFFENKGVKLDTAPAQVSWGKNLYNKIMLMIYDFFGSFGVDVRGAKAKLEGYKDYVSKQKVDETFKVLSGYMGESVKGITDIKDKEALVAKMEGLGLPVMSGDNLLSGPIMQIIFTGEESAWNNLPDDFDKDILKSVRGKYLTLKDNPRSLGGMTTLQKLNEIFTIEEEKKEEYLERYESDALNREETTSNTNIAPIVAPETPTEPTEAEKVEQEAQGIKNAQEADEKLIKAEKELGEAKALPDTDTEKNTKITTKEKNLEEAKKQVSTMVEGSKKEIDETLKNAENDLSDLKISVDQATTKVSEINKKFLASGSKDKAIENELNAAKEELKNLEIKKTTLEKAIIGIKKEIEKFPTDDTKKITAVEAVKSSQEAERLYTNSGDIAEVQLTTEDKEKEGQEFSKNLENLKKEMEAILYTGGDDYWKIDNPEDVAELQKKLDVLIKGKDDELLKGNDGNITHLKTKIDFSLAKIELIKLWKKKEKEFADSGVAPDYDAMNNVVEVDGVNIEIDIDGEWTERELMKTTDPLATRLGGPAQVVNCIMNSTNHDILEEKKKFTSKSKKEFVIAYDSK